MDTERKLAGKEDWLEIQNTKYEAQVLTGEEVRDLCRRKRKAKLALLQQCKGSSTTSTPDTKTSSPSYDQTNGTFEH